MLQLLKQWPFRVLFAIAAYYDLGIDQLDAETAFLYGLINQLVYVQEHKILQTESTKNIVLQALKIALRAEAGS